jgi:hypothetical protein
MPLPAFPTPARLPTQLRLPGSWALERKLLNPQHIAQVRGSSLLRVLWAQLVAITMHNKLTGWVACKRLGLCPIGEGRCCVSSCRAVAAAPH